MQFRTTLASAILYGSAIALSAQAATAPARRPSEAQVRRASPLRYVPPLEGFKDAFDDLVVERTDLGETYQYEIAFTLSVTADQKYKNVRVYGIRVIDNRPAGSVPAGILHDVQGDFQAGQRVTVSATLPKVYANPEDGWALLLCVGLTKTAGCMHSRNLLVTSPSQSNAIELQRLAAQRKKWKSLQPASYRLCVSTFNELLQTVTEADVVEGSVRVARHAEGGSRRCGDGDDDRWSPSSGLTIEALFDQIERGLSVPAGNGPVRYVIEPTYDARLGFPSHIHSGPDRDAAVRIADADVDTSVSLVPNPAIPLRPIAAGEAYEVPKRGHVTRPGSMYFVIPASDGMRALWPALADQIVERGEVLYWNRVGWKLQAGAIGDVLGTLKSAGGQSVYLMSFVHNGEVVFCAIGMDGVSIDK